MLIDSYDRVVDYLRVSVTERCNFRCQYCMPEKPFSWVPKENLLSFEELFEFMKIAIDEGVKKIRITGGEPLLREALDKFIKMIYDYEPEIDLSMTTNGFLLKGVAQKLKDAGLKRINISIDTLKPEVAHTIAGKDVLKNVLEGVEEALRVGLSVKVNMVPMKGLNADEIVEVLEYCKERNISIRFIEYMENAHAKVDISGMKSTELLEILSAQYSFVDNGFDGASPSHYYTMSDGYSFGIIEPYEDDFCKKCNRIRLTAEGNLIPCLYFDEAMSIRDAIKRGDIKGAALVLKEVVRTKPEKNRWGGVDGELSSRAFYETGG
ncbi:MAG: GTP 3',8-cyclase MoaA [Epsilonproteobacteria bacterium]|nr:GTP 3',8-cyclase MoaA [Campylobacterota bacterium]OIO14710.1 MAG: cyclic pyranopterin phosphate synthase [Helicobacteraceae bacterium CG1_02_36_14]PIP09472.1 MAG: GTP 3',8-cyclase MoaA [Sulfurimonas sp. CG23_combo_of_CG06-09_8_20_14_all_36_33]PIS26827.1 MAG: GTP 3',8-cyclase MoaA [Sulfurimonas sp. CG08_land_8_20_14_0_20_36_33]PIU34173.1 MAG: GTP 3',8-cyclase MoaA [Sulfurimonas sp. CG07_land_8_20_14_0_80_36_56]PIV05256.1 MAG: GTP 3',8-cyclase MoaA [Sulfurimonas sp. CG03_land_8_20_14_0_80_36_